MALFDLSSDPAEVKNLALDRTADAKLPAEMNGKLEAITSTRSTSSEACGGT